MKKLVPCLLSLLLSTSCGQLPAVSTPIEPCVVPPAPKLEVTYLECGDKVCISVPDAIKLARFLNLSAEYQIAVRRCPYIKEDTRD